MVSLHDRRIFPGARLEKIVVPRFNLSNILDQLIPEAGAFDVMDHGYIDFARPHRRHPPGNFFVTREKKNAGYAAPLFASRGSIHGHALRSDARVAGDPSARTTCSLYEILRILSLNPLEKTPQDMLRSRYAEMPDGLRVVNPQMLFE